MPCQDPDYREIETSIKIHEKNKENKTLESLLCSSCRVLERLNYDFDENPRLSEWWAKHKREDEERARKEIQ